MVDASAKKDIQDASVYEGNIPPYGLEYTLPKFYLKAQYCISCAIHAKIVRVRNHEQRKIRYSAKKRLTVQLSRHR